MTPEEAEIVEQAAGRKLLYSKEGRIIGFRYPHEHAEETPYARVPLEDWEKELLSDADLAALEKIREAPSGLEGDLGVAGGDPGFQDTLRALGLDPADAELQTPDSTEYADRMGLGRGILDDGTAMVAIVLDGDHGRVTRLLDPMDALRAATTLSSLALTLLDADRQVEDEAVAGGLRTNQEHAQERLDTDE